jgi:hypothetical protein
VKRLYSYDQEQLIKAMSSAYVWLSRRDSDDDPPEGADSALVERGGCLVVDLNCGQFCSNASRRQPTL